MANHIIFSNNGATTLDVDYTATDTTIVLAPGEGAKFPNPTGGQVVKLTITQAGNETYWETCEMTARSGDTLTIGGFGSSWPAGSKLENRITVSYLQTLAEAGVNSDITELTVLDLTGGMQGTSSGNNYGIGPGTLQHLSTGTFNVAYGTNSVHAVTSGQYNVGIGDYVLQNTQGGLGNVGIGHTVLNANVSSNYNTGVGYAALTACTAESNTAVGALAASATTTGGLNTSIGAMTLWGNISGAFNVALGYGAIVSARANSYNVAVGYASLPGVYAGGSDYPAGNYNVAVGDNTLTSNYGSNNTAIGSRAGSPAGGSYPNTTGSNNTFLGFNAEGASSTASNTITLGNGSIGTLRCQVTSITSLSDERDKTDIKPLRFGLDFLNRLLPVEFEWNTRDGAKVGIKSAGFSAQKLLALQEEFGAEALDLVSTENPDKLEARYGHLIPVLVRAIQELSARIDELEAR